MANITDFTFVHSPYSFEGMVPWSPIQPRHSSQNPEPFDFPRLSMGRSPPISIHCCGASNNNSNSECEIDGLTSTMPPTPSSASAFSPYKPSGYRNLGYDFLYASHNTTVPAPFSPTFAGNDWEAGIVDYGYVHKGVESTISNNGFPWSGSADGACSVAASSVLSSVTTPTFRSETTTTTVTTVASAVSGFDDENTTATPAIGTVFGNPCAHSAQWKRLRSKKGYSHYICGCCGERWRKYNGGVPSHLQ